MDGLVDRWVAWLDNYDSSLEVREIPRWGEGGGDYQVEKQKIDNWYRRWLRGAIMIIKVDKA